MQNIYAYFVICKIVRALEKNEERWNPIKWSSTSKTLMTEYLTQGFKSVPMEKNEIKK